MRTDRGQESKPLKADASAGNDPAAWVREGVEHFMAQNGVKPGGGGPTLSLDLDARPLRRHREPRHQRGEAASQRQLRGMMPVCDDPAAGDHDVANRGCAAGKQEMIERILEWRAGHAGMGALEHQPIGPVTDGDAACGLTNRLRADSGGVAP